MVTQNKNLLQLLKRSVQSQTANRKIINKIILLLNASGVSPQKGEFLSNTFISNINSSFSLSDLEKENRNLLGPNVIRTVLHNLSSRSEIVSNQIKSWVSGKKILDFGGGNGHIAKQLQKKLNVDITLIDSVNYQDTNFPFNAYSGVHLPLMDKSFDTVLLIAVLHHAEDPYSILQEARRIGHRIVIIETVLHNMDDKEMFLETAFFDWFYNRLLLGYNIQIPCTFNTSTGWETILKQDLSILHSEYLGQDQKLLFLMHHLFVCE